MKWSELTSYEIEALDREIVLVVPLASCEQHGRHLPVFSDTIQVEEIARRVEARRQDRLVLFPTLWLGASHHHLDFAGTVSLRPSLYSAVIQSVARCILHQGFRRIFFLNGHGGNIIPASQALGDLIVSDDKADAASIALSGWWQVASEAMAAERHGMKTAHVTHACEYETSIVLAIREDLVKLGELSSDHLEKMRPWADPRWKGKVEGFHRFHRWTSSGHMGDPASATVEKGRSLLASVSDSLVTFVDEFADWPHMETLR